MWTGGEREGRKTVTAALTIIETSTTVFIGRAGPLSGSAENEFHFHERWMLINHYPSSADGYLIWVDSTLPTSLRVTHGPDRALHRATAPIQPRGEDNVHYARVENDFEWISARRDVNGFIAAMSERRLGNAHNERRLEIREMTKSTKNIACAHSSRFSPHLSIFSAAFSRLQFGVLQFAQCSDAEEKGKTVRS